MKTQATHHASEGRVNYGRRKFIFFSTATVVSIPFFITGCATGYVDSQQALTIVKQSNGLLENEEVIINRLIDSLLDQEHFSIVSKMTIANNVDIYVRSLNPKMRSDLSLALSLIEYGTLPFALRLQRFSQLSSTDASHYLQSWEQGGGLRRHVMSNIKSIIYLAYWQEPSSCRTLGYEGQVTTKWGLEKLGNLPIPV